MHVVYSDTIKAAGLMIGGMYRSRYIGTVTVEETAPSDFVDVCVGYAEEYE